MTKQFHAVAPPVSMKSNLL